MFKNLFKIKSAANETQPTAAKLSPQLKALVETAPLLMLPQRLFVHFQSDNLKEEPGNPDWENQAVFFWDYDEPFEKKSMPPHFKNYPEHYFVYSKPFPEGMRFLSAEVIPWFGMPGGGRKYHVEFKDAHVTYQRAYRERMF